jgi:hypothetical protein
MTTLGWLFMLVSVGFVWILTGWCYFKVLTYDESGDEQT